MFRKLFRFKIIKNGNIIEAYLDERLDFKTNMKMLDEIVDEDLHKFEIFDPNKKIFLNKDIRIADYFFGNFALLYIFN